MSGCYGNSAEDRYYEHMLDDYLEQFEDDEDPDDEGYDGGAEDNYIESQIDEMRGMI